MNCTQSQNLLHGYLDQELDLTSTLAIDQHLASCAACKTAFEQQSMLRSAVRQNARYHAAPAGLAERIRAQMNPPESKIPKRQAPRWQWLPVGQWLRLGTAIAATAVLTWTTTLQFNGPSADERIAEQVITGHARSVLTGHIADVASSDRHTVKPWLSGKLDFSPPVTDLTGAGFPLIGGRLDYLDNRPVAALVYRRRQHLISLFVWPDEKSGRTAPAQSSPRQGYHILHWRVGDMTYWAISDLDATELKTFAESYAGAQAASGPQ
jgi:anti-sigma factor RsiW